MVLKIILGLEREKRLKKHLEKEHPSVRGHIFIMRQVKKKVMKKRKGSPLWLNNN